MQQVLKESRATLKLAVPIAIGQLSQMLMGIVDSIMIGRIGAVPLAASAFGGSIFNVFFIVGLGILMPVSVLASRAVGGGRFPEAGEYLRHGLMFSVVAGVVQVGVVLWLSGHLLWFGQPPEVVAAVNPFLTLIGISLLPALAYLALRQFAESLGRPWVPVIVVLASVALNVVLNWVFIYGNLGSRAFGLTGAGIATLISRTLGTVVIFLWLRMDAHMRPSWPKRWLAAFSGSTIREMLDIGLPCSVGLLFETGVFATVTLMIGWIGVVPLAAHQVAISCTAIVFMIPLGLAIAVGIRMSTELGAGRRDTLLPIWKGAAIMSAVEAALVTLVFLFLGRRIAAIFIGDPAVVSSAAALLVVAGVFQVFDGSQVVSSSALRGMSDVKIPAALTFASYWIVAVPVGYVLGFRAGLGAVGIWWGLALGLAVASVVLGYRFVRLARAPS